MAKKTVVTLVDDLTGEPADATVRFGLDSREYELDLTDANAAQLRDSFARYIAVARKVSGKSRAAGAAGEPAKPFSGFDPAAVRAWAASNGYTVSPRGRIKAEVLEAFRAAGN
ncbi:histone-like nucleoid-structuring protein Lsr2 [Geodermatophilus sp. URMC 64]